MDSNKETKIKCEQEEVSICENEISLFLSGLKKSFNEFYDLDYSENKIIKSIKDISELIESDSIKSFDDKSIFNLYECVEDAIAPNCIKEANDKISSRLKGSWPDYFKLLSKRLDENYYSDFIAAIINFKFKNKFNEMFVKILCEKSGLDSQDKIKATAYREVPLSWFGAIKNSSMRIDLFIDLGDDGVLIIENKTKTKEHDSQTIAYFEAVNIQYKEEKIKALFLTMTGEEAECREKFESYSYGDFYKDIANTFLKANSHKEFQKDEIMLLAPFFKELEYSLFFNHKNIIEKAKKYRDQKEAA